MLLTAVMILRVAQYAGNFLAGELSACQDGLFPTLLVNQLVNFLFVPSSDLSVCVYKCAMCCGCTKHTD